MDETVSRADEVDGAIRAHPWMDFEVWEYVGNELTVAGSIDPSARPDLFIRFSEVFFVSLPIEWNTDTSRRVFSVLEGEEAIGWNLRFRVEQGHHLFSFAPEDHPPGFKCVVAAKRVRVSRSLEGFVRE